MTFKALILAAGKGTRLAPYTNVTPKPLFTLAGRPLLFHWIQRLAAAGCDEIFVNTHHLHEQIEAYIACNQWPVPVHTFYEPELLGTGGAVKNIRSHWRNSQLMVINSDIVCDFDLKEFWRWHEENKNEVSLLLTDCPEFNMVTMDEAGNIASFTDQDNPTALTFTGIQALTPQTLDYIPAETYYSSIDVYKYMIENGHKVRGLLCHEPWQDLGEITRYREATLKAGARKTFGKIFNDDDPIEIQLLQGDGSDRIWRRLSTKNNSVVVADHGLATPETSGKTHEVDAFISIGRHLNAKGLPVGKIYFHDAFAGLVFTEDLGEVSLQTYVQDTHDKKLVIEMYMRIIDSLISCNRDGIKGFELKSTWQTKSYDRSVILQNECAYFRQRFLYEYLGIDTTVFQLQNEFEHLADKIAQHSLWGLMHRDFQSRNIFIKNGQPLFLDYQAARLGPLQYDIASLLFDPYVMLDEATRNLLLNYCTDHEDLLGWHEQVEKGFYYCALSRSMQILGAFAYLSQKKGKSWFKQYMPPALTNLENLLAKTQFKLKFPELRKVTALAREQLQQLF